MKEIAVAGKNGPCRWFTSSMSPADNRLASGRQRRTLDLLAYIALGKCNRCTQQQH